MKVQIFRTSNRPVDVADMEAYSTEWKELFDESEQRAEKLFKKLKRTPKMKIMQRLLKVCEAKLGSKYAATTYVELPTTGEGWQELISKYNIPILITSRTDTNETVLLLQDDLQSY